MKVPPRGESRRQSFMLKVRLKGGEFNEGTAPTTSKANPSLPRKSKTQNWRDRLKESDPQRYRTIKEAAKDYSATYRLRCAVSSLRPQRNLSEKEAEELALWQRRRERNNASARERMRRMKERKQQEAKSRSKSTRKQTRKQHDQIKEKERMKKQKYRSSMSKDQKDEALAKRRAKYHQKRAGEREKLLEAERRRLEEVAADLAAKEVQLQEQNRRLSQEHSLDNRSQNARAKALERARRALPRRRSHCIGTSIELIQKATPTKAAAFEGAGLRANSVLDKAVISAVTEGLRSLPKHSVKRRSLASALGCMKAVKLQRAASRTFKVTRKLLSNAIKRAAGRKSVSLSTVANVSKFYEDNSRILPDKKLVGKKSGKPRHILETSVLELYKKYTLANPEEKVSAASFHKLRPRHVKLRSQAKYIGCLCEYCENVNLKIAVLRRMQPGTSSNLYDVTASTMCSKPSGSEFHNPECIKRECDNCGVDRLDDKLSALDSTRSLEWKRWELTETVCHMMKETKTIKKRGLITKAGTVAEFLSELKAELNPFAEHLFNKDWQHKQQCLLQKNLQRDEASSVFDFAENYTCYYQREVQSAHYMQEAATVHPVVCYYLCTRCSGPVTESCILTSNDLNHDYHLVNRFQEVVMQHLTENRNLPLKKFFRFSDGCSSQYKSKGPISDISYGEKDFGITIHHNYSGIRHGKGASDGESGVVKRRAEEAVKAGVAQIKDAKSLYDYLRAHMTKESGEESCCTPFRRTIFYVPFEDVHRVRPDRAVRTVQGTRKLHSIKGLQGGVVATRNLSCFCDGCKQDSGACHNAKYVEPWKIVQLHRNAKVERAVRIKHWLSGGSDDQISVDRSAGGEADLAAGGVGGSNDQISVGRSAVGKADLIAPGTSDVDDQVELAEDIDVSPPKLDANSYVAVKFSCGSKKNKDFAFMAMVTRKQGEHVQLRFMRLSPKSHYDFTKEPEALNPLEDVIKVVTEPTMILVGRSYVYKFREEELKCVLEDYILK